MATMGDAFFRVRLLLGPHLFYLAPIIFLNGGARVGTNSGGNKNSNGMAGIIAVVGTVATVVTPLIEKAIDNVGKQSDEKTVEKIKIPELYHKGFPIDLEQAMKILEDCGLKSSKSKLTLREANPRYKDCFDLQVINSNPKQGSVVKIGSTVCLKYIPKDVIVESQRIFDESQRTKAEAKERAKENVAGAVNKTKQGVVRILKRNNKEKNTEEGDISNE